MTKMLKYALCGLLLTVSLTACGSKSDTNAGGTASPAPGTTTGGGAASPTPAATTGATTGTTVDAQAVFKQNCVACHGDNLEGKLGPNTNLTKVGSQKSRDQIVTQITNGGNGMIPFKGKLSDAEINALADWLFAKK